MGQAPCFRGRFCLNFTTLADGTSYHVETLGQNTSSKRLIWCHPMASSIANDNSERLWNSWLTLKAQEQWETIRIDARGHGFTPPQGNEAQLVPQSTEEEEFAKDCFTWQAVGASMLAINAAAGNVEKLILGGASMGSAGSLWATCSRNDQKVAGMIMCIPPTCYEEREKRSGALKKHADNDAQAYYDGKKPRAIFKTASEDKVRRVIPREGVREDSFRLVMLGSAFSNFPPTDVVKEKLAGIPVLVCGWEGDPTHPMSSTDLLANLLPHAQVHRAKTLADVDAWPEIIASFIERV